MPRGSRLDAAGAVHHVMGRGIEGRAIFWLQQASPTIQLVDYALTNGRSYIYQVEAVDQRGFVPR